MILSRFPDKAQYLRLAEAYRVVPVCTQILADTLTPVSLLGRFTKARARSSCWKASRAASAGRATASSGSPPT